MVVSRNHISIFDNPQVDSRLSIADRIIAKSIELYYLTTRLLNLIRIKFKSLPQFLPKSILDSPICYGKLASYVKTPGRKTCWRLAPRTRYRAIRMTQKLLYNNLNTTSPTTRHPPTPIDLEKFKGSSQWLLKIF